MKKEEVTKRIAGKFTMLYERMKAGEQVCLSCYIKQIRDLMDELENDDDEHSDN